MARENGQMRICDRCKKKEFLKTIGEGETDGGYTRWNKFEVAKGWTVASDIGDLCPECSELFEQIKDKFKREVESFKSLFPTEE